MDWYNFLTGRPDPGRRAPTRTSRYLDAPERAPSTESTPHRERQQVAPGSPVVPAVREPRARTYRYGRDQAGVPIDVAAGNSQEPFGDDFAVWYNAAVDRGYISDEPVPSEIDNPGREPNNPNNVIADATERLTPEYRATRRTPLYEAHYRSRGNERIGDAQFDPVEEAPASAFESYTATQELDPTREWAAAEVRANERWQVGAPSVTDMFFAAVFGNRGVLGPEARMRRETQQMRDQVRNDQR